MRSLSYGRIRSRCAGENVTSAYEPIRLLVNFFHLRGHHISCYVFASFFPFSSSLLITNLAVFPNFASQTDTFRHPQQLLIMAKEKTTKKTQSEYYTLFFPCLESPCVYDFNAHTTYFSFQPRRSPPTTNS